MKNSSFFRKVRLCLWLYISLACVGCAVFRTGKPVAEQKYYRITAVGEYPLNMAEIADDAVISHWKKEQDGFTMSVKVNNEVALEKLLLRFRNAGLWVRSATLQD